ncbi:flagellar hook-basal body complex protein [Hyphomonas sp.]|jgi:flagellar basal-body rod protein FlgF|uniref:flagellar hook-basal body complex protein n=1 Tax=Hyphomonas sp. TaxID=87 RepID=UPI000C42223E|nr:flagellar basal-body rod protein FlgF [Hyphomonadaceae bacterium]MBA29287.1 flagellar basal-body rod protein FlgF [Hyphomonadaceae bacterium]MBL4878707.1 flagellar hook-basal body complex protein [Hyphomonas sp.]|tara:strand:- start:36342 stop:37055 length:714 start_codon:yes stop_codon:yes gene_type:complete
MSNAIYASLTRQDGLLREMQVIANNMANSSTTGFKSNHAIFAEHIAATGDESGSLSMGSLAGHNFDLSQGAMKHTGGQFDLAIHGEGFFVLDTPAGERLTRAGAFQLSADGNLIDAFGHQVQGAGGGAIAIPQEVTRISIAPDGTISSGEEILGQVAVVVADGEINQEGGTMFAAPGGYQQVEEPAVVQGTLEQSNVSSILEVSRLIEVQRAYEAGQSLIEKEDERINQLIKTMRQL